MRLSSCLTCGIKPLWDATWPRFVQRRADREAAAADAAAARDALARAEAAVQSGNNACLTDLAAQTSWHEAPVGAAPPRPPTPPPLSRPAISPFLARPPSSP